MIKIQHLYKPVAAVISTVLLLMTGCNNSGTDNPASVADKTAAATITVSIGTIGTLAKKSTISLEKLVLTLSCPGQDTVRNTSSLSGTGGNTVKLTLGNLKAPRTWTASAIVFDDNDSCIHRGVTTFVTIPADTAKVAIDLDAKYSMLRVSFNGLTDSISGVTLGITDVDTIESTFTAGTKDTVTLTFDYLEADADGKTYDISLCASGSFYNNDTVLYAADTTIAAISGVDTSYAITLKWVGPDIPKGAAEITVTIGAVGTTTINAWFHSDGSIVNDLVKEVNVFFIDTSWKAWPDGIAAVSNDTAYFVMEAHSSFGIGLVRAIRGDTLDPSDYISGPGAPFESPDGLVMLPDGRFVITNGQTKKTFIIPSGGGNPESFVNGFSSYHNAAIAPASFDGTNVDPGDVIIPSWLPPKIIAVNPDTKVQKTLVNSSFFTGFCSEGVGSLEFGSDGYLYVIWSDYWGDREQPRIYRFDSEGNGELYHQFSDWEYEGNLNFNFDICIANNWIYYFYYPNPPSEYSGEGTIFRMSFDGSRNELLIDLNIKCQNLEVSPDGSRLFVGCGGRIMEIVLNNP